MAAQVGILQTPRLKAMVIPQEHGAWGMLLVPLVTGAVIAVRPNASYGSLVVFVVAALSLFWLRTPVEAWLGTSAIKAQTPEERSTVLRMALLLAVVSCIAIAWLFVTGYFIGLVEIGAVAAGAFLLQAVVKQMGRSGRMPAQVIGAVGLTATAAGAYYVTSGRFDGVAIVLWVANWLFAGNQVHFVQIRIRSSRVESSVEKARQAYGFLGGQLLLIAAIFIGTRLGYFPKFTIIAFVPALLRGSLWFVRRRQPLDVHKLGFSELGQVLLFGGLLCGAFRLN